MLNLIKQDIKKINLIMLIGLNALILIFVKENQSFTMLFVAPLFFTSSSLMSSLFGDLTHHYDRFTVSLPITRREFVASKYLYAFIILFATGLLNTLLITIAKSTGFIELVSYEPLKVLFSLSFLLLAALLVLFFTIENSRIIAWINIILYGVILMSASLIENALKFITRVFDFDIDSMFTSGMISYIAIIASLIVYGISYFIAMKRYMLKDI